MKLSISLCQYQSGEFDLFIESGKRGEGICITGKREFEPHELDFINKYMPSCVMTTYERPDDE